MQRRCVTCRQLKAIQNRFTELDTGSLYAFLSALASSFSFPFHVRQINTHSFHTKKWQNIFGLLFKINECFCQLLLNRIHSDRYSLFILLQSFCGRVLCINFLKLHYKEVLRFPNRVFLFKQELLISNLLRPSEILTNSPVTLHYWNLKRPT